MFVELSAAYLDGRTRNIPLPTQGDGKDSFLSSSISPPSRHVNATTTGGSRLNAQDAAARGIRSTTFFKVFNDRGSVISRRPTPARARRPCHGSRVPGRYRTPRGEPGTSVDRAACPISYPERTQDQSTHRSPAPIRWSRIDL